MKYKCRKAKEQEYQCQVCAKPFFSKKKFICFDKCLVDELFYLWDLEIETTGSCCGHGIYQPYIGVTDSNIKKMKSLGYKVLFNPCIPHDRSTFGVSGSTLKKIFQKK